MFIPKRKIRPPRHSKHLIQNSLNAEWLEMFSFQKGYLNKLQELAGISSLNSVHQIHMKIVIRYLNIMETLLMEEQRFHEGQWCRDCVLILSVADRALRSKSWGVTKAKWYPLGYVWYKWWLKVTVKAQLSALKEYHLQNINYSLGSKTNVPSVVDCF
jgi:hypothetical protein